MGPKLLRNQVSLKTTPNKTKNKQSTSQEGQAHILQGQNTVRHNLYRKGGKSENK